MAIKKKKEVKEHEIVYLRNRSPNSMATHTIGVVMECSPGEDVKVWWCGNEEDEGYNTAEKKEDLIVF